MFQISMIIYKVFSIGIIKFLSFHCFCFLYARNFMIDMLLFCKIYFRFLLLFTRFSVLVLCNFFYSIIFCFCMWVIWWLICYHFVKYLFICLIIYRVFCIVMIKFVWLLMWYFFFPCLQSFFLVLTDDIFCFIIFFFCWTSEISMFV